MLFIHLFLVHLFVETLNVLLQLLDLILLATD
jgi:hypothetical protein